MKTTLVAMLCLGLTGCVGTAGGMPGMFTGGATGTALGPGTYPAAPPGPYPGAVASAAMPPAAVPADQPVSAAEIAHEEKYCAPIDIMFHLPGCQHANMMKVWGGGVSQQQAAAAEGAAAGSVSGWNYSSPVRGRDY